MATQKFMGRGMLLDRLTAQVGSVASAKAILMKRGQMDSTGKFTAKGEARNRMTAAERAIDRASKSTGKAKTSFMYDPRTNRAIKR